MDLNERIKRHRFLHNYLEIASIDSLLRFLREKKVNFDEVSITSKTYQVGVLVATQQYLGDKLMGFCKNGLIWNAQSIFTFTRGQHVNFKEEDIITVRWPHSPTYCFVGHCRVKTKYMEHGRFAYIDAIDVCHSKVRDYIEPLITRIGSLKVCDLQYHEKQSGANI